jgi:hypothetical protein
MVRSVSNSVTAGQPPARNRHEKVVAAAREAGLLQGVRGSIGVRIPQPLIDAAREKTGLTSTTDIVEYALAKVALEDDFGVKLVARKGRIPRDLDLEL